MSLVAITLYFGLANGGMAQGVTYTNSKAINMSLLELANLFSCKNVVNMVLNYR